MTTRAKPVDLFTPLTVGPITIPNRIVMAPLTRNRAGSGNVPTDLNASYHAQRATAGLIISEANPASPQGHGYPAIPGIHDESQVTGWRKVPRAVHARDGHIFLQLWHVGRISHPSLQPDGGLPVAPSAMRPAGEAATYTGPQPCVTPRANANLTAGAADMVALGGPFLANPDLPERFTWDAPLNTPDETTFYGGEACGYTDYPSLVIAGTGGTRCRGLPGHRSGSRPISGAACMGFEPGAGGWLLPAVSRCINCSGNSD